MELRIEHRIGAPIDDVVGASMEDAFNDRLTQLPNVAERTVTTFDRRPDGSIHRIVRYRFAGHLPAPVLRVIGGSTVSWDEEGMFDPNAREWRYEIHPHVMKGRFRCNGRYRFVPDGQTTNRVVEADIRVSVPLVGGRVAKVIADGMKDTFEAEARMLNDYVGARS
jgi:hypothetical protein